MTTLAYHRTSITHLTVARRKSKRQMEQIAPFFLESFLLLLNYNVFLLILPSIRFIRAFYLFIFKTNQCTPVWMRVLWYGTLRPSFSGKRIEHVFLILIESWQWNHHFTNRLCAFAINHSCNGLHCCGCRMKVCLWKRVVPFDKMLRKKPTAIQRRESSRESCRGDSIHFDMSFLTKGDCENAIDRKWLYFWLDTTI